MRGGVTSTPVFALPCGDDGIGAVGSYLQIKLGEFFLFKWERNAAIGMIDCDLDGGDALSDDAETARCLVCEVYDTALAMRSAVNDLDDDFLSVCGILHKEKSTERMGAMSTLK